jgi:hypothetical protein
MLTRLKLVTFLRGAEFTIRILSETEETELMRFIDETLPEADRKQVYARLERAAEVAPPRNVEQCRELDDGIFEFKTKNVRIFWFYDRGRIILLSHARMKKDVRVNPEIERVKLLRERYLREGADES